MFIFIVIDTLQSVVSVMLVFVNDSPHGDFSPWFIVSGFDILLV